MPICRITGKESISFEETLTLSDEEIQEILIRIRKSHSRTKAYDTLRDLVNDRSVQDFGPVDDDDWTLETKNESGKWTDLLREKAC